MVLIDVAGFPFPLKGKSFNELSEDEEKYFCDLVQVVHKIAIIID